jgi:tetratricopeptide (TPR) repeat protein
VIGRRALVAAAPAWLAACAAPPQTAALRAAAGAARKPAELDATPFFPQTELHCGPAALATVLVAAGRSADPSLLADEVFLPSRGGTLQVEMLAGARRHDALAVRLAPRLDALMAEIDAGTPVVVLQNLGLSFAPRWHYAVLVGHDVARDEMVLRSGTTRRATMGFTPFEHTWSRGGHWAFVALAPGRLPESADEAHVTEAALAFERVARPASAALAYATASGRWPDSLVLAMGLGNSRHAAGDLAGAAVAFERAASVHDSAAAWNNLARARWALGEPASARAAAWRALQRARDAEPRWLEAAQATARTVGAGP